jgi:hypothetical protein
MDKNLSQTLKSIPLYSLSKGSARICSNAPEFSADFTAIGFKKLKGEFRTPKSDGKSAKDEAPEEISAEDAW